MCCEQIEFSEAGICPGNPTALEIREPRSVQLQIVNLGRDHDRLVRHPLLSQRPRQLNTLIERHIVVVVRLNLESTSGLALRKLAAPRMSLNSLAPFAPMSRSMLGASHRDRFTSEVVHPHETVIAAITRECVARAVG